MKKLLFLLLLCGTAKAQGSLELYIYASELRGDTRRDQNNQAVVFVGDTLKNGSVGGVLWMCDTCYSTTLWKDDSTNVFVYNSSIGVVWVRRKSYPTLKVITDGLGYTPIGWTDTITKVATKTNVATKEPIIAAGTTGQYYRGDKTWQTLPTTKYLASFALSGVVNKIITGYMSNGDTVQTPVLKIPVSYVGTTNASGLYTVTFAQAYSTTPNIQANVIGQSTEVQSRIVSVSTTGFSVHVFQRVAVLTLALSTATTNVSGATVHATITEN